MIELLKIMARVRLLHSTVPGRARFQINDLYRDEKLAKRIRAAFVSLPGIISLIPRPLTANLLVLYDPRVIRLPQLSKLLRQLLQQPQEKRTDPLRGVDWDAMSPDEVIRALRTSCEKGLSRTLWQERQRAFGINSIPVMGHRSEWSIALNQFENLPTLLLLFSSGVSVLSGGMADALVIMGVVAVNSCIGYFTESSAQKTIASLISDRAPKVRVLRDGVEAEVLPEAITVGDILMLTPGVTVPADARVLQSRYLTVDESVLTGESVPVVKAAEPKVRENAENRKAVYSSNRIFRGTQIIGGSGYAAVIAIGSATEVGKIQLLMGKSSPPETPLQRQLAILGRQTVILSLGSSGLVFLIAKLRGYSFREIWRVSVSLAVAAIPESLPTIATTTLARGVKNLNEQGALVRNLGAVETFGNVDLICLDKTGTLTLNQMTVTEVVTAEGAFRKNSKGFRLGGKRAELKEFPSLRKLLRMITLCNEAEISLAGNGNESGRESGTYRFSGSPTESALLEAGLEGGLKLLQIRKRWPVREVHYRTERRSYMVTIHPHSRGTLLAVKGRPDQVLGQSAYFLLGKKKILLSEKRKKAIRKKYRELGHQGLRVLGVAYGVSQERNPPPHRLVWLGLVAMTDPVRSGMKETMRQLHQAGIHTAMITGDQKETAVFIGKTLGLNNGREMKVFDGALDANQSFMADGPFHVYSRINPSTKLDIVRRLQKSGHVVAMIGDGINDGPALKVADVGVAMGARGAEVATRVADIVLRNDDLSKILMVLKEGRTVRQDIHKAVRYILTQNLAEILFTISSLFVGIQHLLSPMQLLWMNLVTDIFPELALAQDPSEAGILRRPPESRQNGILTRTRVDRVNKMVFESLLIAGSGQAGGFYGRFKGRSDDYARTLSFLTLVTGSLLYSLSCRTDQFIWSHTNRPVANRLLPLSIVLGMLMEGVGLLVPRARRILQTVPLSGGDLVLGAGISLIPIIMTEIGKLSAQLKDDEISELKSKGNEQEKSYGIV